MRLSATLFAGSRSRPVAALKKPLGSASSSTSPEFMPWLSSLKSTQLQRVARATGIQSSGTKGVLIQRIRDELRNNVQVAHETQPRDKSSREWRILSIDMGIRNLAFAFMVVPCPLSISAGTSSGDGQDQGHERIKESEPDLPKLQAWRRLSVLDGLSDLSTTSTAPASDSESTDSIAVTKDSYSPAIYASTAYKLLTTLLSTHNPTHILIERQRFRSAGSSAVQEWTLRVGVFEGMLYAILHTLRQERGLDRIYVEGVEPKRVVGFWDEIGGNNAGTSTDTETVDGMKSLDGKRLTAREVKQAKVGIVGGWVEGSLDGSSDGKIVVGEDDGVREIAGAYVRKWRGERGTKNGDVGKLDDLADCLLQGVTWLEWQVMRERIVREGMKALE